MKLKVKNDSGWNFWELFDKSIKELMEHGKANKTYSKQGYKDAMEQALITFLQRLPSGDYSNLINEWNERD